LTLAYLASMIIGTLVRGTAISGYATLLMGVLGFGGLHLLFLGLIGEYLERIYAESKQRPHFLVKEQSAPAFVRPAVSLSAPPRCIAADP
jgi:hypothetical protein